MAQVGLVDHDLHSDSSIKSGAEDTHRWVSLQWRKPPSRRRLGGMSREPATRCDGSLRCSCCWLICRLWIRPMSVAKLKWLARTFDETLTAAGTIWSDANHSYPRYQPPSYRRRSPA